MALEHGIGTVPNIVDDRFEMMLGSNIWLDCTQINYCDRT